MDFSKFAASVIGDEREIYKRFEECLRFKIYTTVTESRYTAFKEVVEVFRRVEHSISKGWRVYALKQKHVKAG